MMWMNEPGLHKPVDGSSSALFKLHPDIRLNCLANWTCLLAVAPIYVHPLLQLVHLHYWNGLSSGLDWVAEPVKGREKGSTQANPECIILKIKTLEALELVGRKLVECECWEMSSFHPFPTTPTPSCECAASASGCCSCESSIWDLSNKQLEINTHQELWGEFKCHNQIRAIFHSINLTENVFR